MANYGRTVIPMIQAILAYEWLISGADKVLSGKFIMGLYNTCLSSLPGMKYRFYANILRSVCLPHCQLIASIVVVGEIGVGISFIVLAMYSLKSGQNVSMTRLGMVTGIVSSFMNLNFFFYQGANAFLQTSDPFDEGVSIDFIMLLIELSLAAMYFSMIRANDRSVRARVPNHASISSVVPEGHPPLQTRHRKQNDRWNPAKE